MFERWKKKNEEKKIPLIEILRTEFLVTTHKMGERIGQLRKLYEVLSEENTRLRTERVRMKAQLHSFEVKLTAIEATLASEALAAEQKQQAS